MSTPTQRCSLWILCNENDEGFDEEWYDVYAEYQSQYEDGNSSFYGSEDDSNGIDDDEFVDAQGDVWNKVDEYGEMSYMWDYM